MVNGGCWPVDSRVRGNDGWCAEFCTSLQWVRIGSACIDTKYCVIDSLVHAAGTLLHPQLQPRLQQAFRHLVLAHEFRQQPMYFSGFVHVPLYHVVELVRIGRQIVELRHPGFRAVEQTPLS